MGYTTYQQLLDAVQSYYGYGSDQWYEIVRFGVNAETVNIIKQVPGVTITQSIDGTYLGYDYSNPFETEISNASNINSNVQSGIYGNGSFNANIPGNVVTDSQTQTTTIKSGVTKTATGLTLSAVADKISLAYVGTSLGTKLGKTIDSAIYAINPEWWDVHYPAINPETWDTMATTQGGKNFIRAIFGLENDDATMYLDERLLAYTYQLLLANGGFNSGEYKVQTNTNNLSIGLFPIPFNFIIGSLFEIRTSSGTQYITTTNDVCAVMSNAQVFISSTIPFSITYAGYTTQSAQRTVNNKSFHYVSMVINNWQNFISSNIPRYNITSPSTQQGYNVGYLMLYEGIELPPLPGVRQDPNAQTIVNPQSLINPSTGSEITASDDIEDVLLALKTQYPSLFNDSVSETVLQPDGTTKTYNYIPSPYPNTANNNQPTTGNNHQNNPSVNPETNTETLLQQITDLITSITQPPDTGTGDAPIIPVISGSASHLWSVYNPSLSDINDFGAWLWSSNFIDNLLKVFSNPMDAIIGIHKVYVTPDTGSTQPIKCGFLTSSANAKIVTNQYKSIDCGSVQINEYFGNILDYSPYTRARIYLPFIGFVSLDINEIMRSTINVKYNVDVITGACLANIIISRDGYGGTLYSYGGSAIVTYPLSGGNYTGLINGLVGAGLSVAGGVISGNPAMALGAVGNIASTRLQVQHSGGFNGCSGAMGIKKPYIVIDRSQSNIADNFNIIEGYGANTTTKLNNVTGFVRCKTIKLSCNAYNAELDEIINILKGGVYV